MGNSSIELDRISRIRIVSETDRNFFVEAGAGSGKTTMLVNRMVAMVENGLDISKICAITFTKAAAGEFYKRFQQLLSERSSPNYRNPNEGRPGQLPAPTELSRARCEEALKKIDLCFMGTIDSFCNLLLSEHPTEAGIPADATLISEEELISTLRKEYVRICGGEYGAELQKAAQVFHGANYSPEEVFCAGMKLLLEHRNASFQFDALKTLDFDKFFAEDKRNLLEVLETLNADPGEYQQTGSKESRKAWDSLPDVLHGLNFKWSRSLSTVTYLLKQIEDLRILANDDNRRRFEGGFYEPHYSRSKVAWLQPSFNSAAGLMTRLNDLLYRINMTFLTKCVPVLEQTLLDQGAMSYFDYLYYLRNMLREDAAKDGSLISYIYNRHSYFLIDEFQDTNPMQAEVFFYLCAEKPMLQWRSCVPKPGSLFIVGDPKQSIYRFRNADVTSFLRVKELFCGEVGEVLELTCNFRSNKALCGEFNRIFSETLKEETATQSKFTEIPLEDKPHVEEFRGIYKCFGGYADPDNVGQQGYAPPEETAVVIRKLVHNEHFKIRDAATKELRTLNYRDFMLITTAKATLRDYEEAFTSFDIPCHVEGNVPFERNAALSQLVLLYYAAVNPTDGNAVTGALMSPFFGFHHYALAEYVEQGGYLSAGFPTAEKETHTEAEAAVEAALQTLRELHSKAALLGPSAFYLYLLEQLKIYTVLEAEDLEIVYYTLELLRGKEKGGTVVTHEDAITYLRTLLTSTEKEERCLSLSEDNDCVHLANLHKVKGLEAPVVILAYASPAKKRAPETRYVYLDETTEGYVFRVKKGNNKGDHFSTSYFEEEKNLEQDAKSDENVRADYVAATRAMNVLILGYLVKLLKAGPSYTSRWDCFAQDCTPCIQTKLANEPMCALPEPVTEDAADLYARGEADNVLNDRSAEEKSYEIRLPSQAKADSKLKEEAAADYSEETLPAVENDKGSSAADTSARAEAHRHPTVLGTMTHRLMELLVTSHGRIDIAAAIPEIISEFSDCCDETNRAFAEVLQQAAQRMQNGGYPQQNGLPTDMLAELLSAEEVYCEVPFCYTDTADPEAPIWNGVMDVVYCKNAVWHIVDYKTNLDGSDLDRHYQGQLQAYIRAFRALTGHEADAMTYHISI